MFEFQTREYPILMNGVFLQRVSSFIDIMLKFERRCTKYWDVRNSVNNVKLNRTFGLKARVLGL